MSIIETDQFFDTPITTCKRGPFVIRYAYARSADLEETEERGQDYLAFHAEPDRVAFAICDGVSNSFLGGLAAQILGENLLKFLWTLKSDLINEDTETLKNSLKQFLNSNLKQANSIVDRRDLTGIHNELVINALEQRRNRSGSQSNFVCGLIFASTRTHPNGRVLLFWLGDARLQIWSDDINQSELLKGEWSSKEGWSSLQGTHGEIHIYSGDSSSINNIFAYTDGLITFEKQISPNITDDYLDSSITGLKRSHNDDISFLHISVSNTQYDSKDDLTAELRAEQPAIIIEKKIERKYIPPSVFIIAGATTILFTLLGLFFGYQLGSNQPAEIPTTIPTVEENIFEPLLLMTNEVHRTEMPVVLPTETPTTDVTESPQLSPTGEVMPIRESGLGLLEVIRQPILLKKECTNLIDLGLTLQSELEVTVVERYILMGYPTLNCEGDLSYVITETFPKGDWSRLNIQSIKLIEKR